MTRVNARETAVMILFGANVAGEDYPSFCDRFLEEEHFASLSGENETYAEKPDEAQLAYIKGLVSGVYEHLEEIDALISQYLRGWTLSRIPGTALAALRCAVYEIKYSPDVPDGAAINAAVEIDKKYDDPETVSFVNGVLRSITRAEQ